MGIKFSDAKADSGGGKIDSYKFENGEQKVRLFGDIVPRYLYWVPNPKGTPQNLPVEALQYDRETQTWDNSVTEPVKEHFPDLKPKWSYSSLCFNADGEVKVFNFKKTLLGQIQDAADSLGDPSDIEDGWWVVFKKKKTGPNPMNVEYSLDALKSQKNKEPLSDELKEKVENTKPIDELFPRPTEEQVRKQLDNIMSSGPDEEVDEEAVKEAQSEFNID